MLELRSFLQSLRASYLVLCILCATHTQPMLLDIFTAYAKADTSLGQVRSGGLATINFQEMLLLARDGQLIDERLTIISITTVRACMMPAADAAIVQQRVRFSVDRIGLCLDPGCRRPRAHTLADGINVTPK